MCERCAFIKMMQSTLANVGGLETLTATATATATGVEAEATAATANGAAVGASGTESPTVPTASSLDDTLYTVLYDQFGHTAFRPGQEGALRTIESGVDAVVIQATGNGKSLLYQLPTIKRRCVDPDVVTVVVSPLVSLMVDQCNGLNSKFRIDVSNNLAVKSSDSSSLDTDVACYLGSAQPDQTVWRRAMDGEFAFVFVTPEKISTWETQLQKLMPKVLLFAIDECHCVSAHGLDFRPAYRDIGTLRDICPHVPMLALTATATDAVIDDVVTSLKLQCPQIHKSTFDRPNLSFHFKPRGDAEETVYAIAAEFNKCCRKTNGLCIVYVLTQKNAETLASKLSLKQVGVPSEAYHAGMPAAARKAVASRFQSGDVRCVVATISFGMGIDQPNVRLVVHNGMSKSVDAYMQEAGRAGRDGRPARCVCMYSDADVITHQRMATNNPKAHAHIRAMFELTCNPLGVCRRKRILDYFGEASYQGPCVAGCDVCDRRGAIKKQRASLLGDPNAQKLRDVARVYTRGRNAQVELLVGRGKRPVPGTAEEALFNTAGKPRSANKLKELHRRLEHAGLLKRLMGRSGAVYYTA